MSGIRAITASAVAAFLLLGATACGGGSSAGPRDSEGPIKIAFFAPKTGALASYGPSFESGFKVGIQYATNGTGEVDGRKVEATVIDDASDPSTAVAAAKNFIAKGGKIIVGAISSAVCNQLAALAAQNDVLYVGASGADDALSGINRNTFRAERQTTQDILTLKSDIGSVSGKKIVTFAQDYAFGQSAANSVDKVLGPDGAKTTRVLAPLDATDFTPYAAKILAEKPDVVYVSWGGGAAAMWKTLIQQGVFEAAKVYTFLNNRPAYEAYGPASAQLTAPSEYFPQANQNKANQYLIAGMKKQSAEPDELSSPGFIAAQQAIHAAEASAGLNTDEMIKALEGWSFLTPAGQVTIRKQDHALLQPMYIARLKKQGSAYVPYAVKTISADQVAPPVGEMK